MLYEGPRLQRALKSKKASAGDSNTPKGFDDETYCSHLVVVDDNVGVVVAIPASEIRDDVRDTSTTDL